MKNEWPPIGFDPNLPADFQGIFDPGADDEEPTDLEGRLAEIMDI